MKKVTALISILMVLCLCLGACSTTKPDEVSSTEPQQSSADTSTADSSTSDAEENTASNTSLDGSLTIGVMAALTGTNKASGEYVKNGATLAVEKINAEGGILGKELKVEFGDEVDNLQASVNGMSMLMSNEDIVAIVGSYYSTNGLAVMPAVLENKIPTILGGSNAAIPEENNPYIWQVRTVDNFTAVVMGDVAANTLEMKNPAIIYSTQSSTQALAEQTAVELEKYGVEVNKDLMFGFPEEEKNYAPIITQIQNSDADGLIAIANQLPAAMICQQVEAASLDLPCLGSTSFASEICLENAGASANGWYSIADWTPAASTPNAKEFADAYVEKFGAGSDMPSAYTYDSIMILRDAIERAGSTDKEAINNALAEVKDLEGAMTIYTSDEEHRFATSLFITQNKDGVAEQVGVAEYK